LKLNRLCRRSTLDFALSVGRLIVAELYVGDLEHLRSRNPRKDSSLRKLAKHPDLPMSPAGLCRSVAMFELHERLGGASWKHVSTSHMRLVLPLAPADQEHLIRMAEKNRWTTRRLADDVASLAR